MGQTNCVLIHLSLSFSLNRYLNYFDFDNISFMYFYMGFVSNLVQFFISVIVVENFFILC